MKKTGIIVTLVLIMGGGYLFFGYSNSVDIKTKDKVAIVLENEETNDVSEEDTDVSDEVRVINITAGRFEFDQKTIEVKKGETVRFVIEDKDVPHGIVVPELLDPSVQDNYNDITITLDNEGEFSFYCATPCGAGHGSMQGRIIVS